VLSPRAPPAGRNRPSGEQQHALDGRRVRRSSGRGCALNSPVGKSRKAPTEAAGCAAGSSRHDHQALCDTARSTWRRSTWTTRGVGQVCRPEGCSSRNVQEALEPRARVIGSLPLHAMRQQHHETAHAVPTSPPRAQERFRLITLRRASRSREPKLPLSQIVIPIGHVRGCSRTRTRARRPRTRASCNLTHLALFAG